MNKIFSISSISPYWFSYSGTMPVFSYPVAIAKIRQADDPKTRQVDDPKTRQADELFATEKFINKISMQLD